VEGGVSIEGDSDVWIFLVSSAGMVGALAAREVMLDDGDSCGSKLFVEYSAFSKDKFCKLITLSDSILTS
jgi:hypothetical protein